MKLLIFILIPISIFSQTTDYPDTLYLKSGQMHPCLVTQIEESSIKLKYGNNKTFDVHFTAVEKLTLDPVGIVYTDKSGFSNDVSQLQKITDIRYSSTIPAYIQVKLLEYTPIDTTLLYSRSAFLIQFWGPEILGFHFILNPLNRISINMGLGLFGNMHLGINYYFIDRTRSTSSIYIGSQFALVQKFILFGTGGEGQLGMYIPLGYEYMARNGFIFQVDFGANIIEKDWGQRNTKPFLASLKIGYAY